MVRIMVVTNSLTGGGAERSMNLVCNILAQRGWPVTLVPINLGPPDSVEPICDVYPIGRKWRGGIVDTLSAIYRFAQISRRLDPKIVVLNCDLPELFGAVVKRGSRVVILEHSSYSWSHRRSIGWIVRNYLDSRKAIWTAVSPHLNPIWPTGKVPKAILQNPVKIIGSKIFYGSSVELKRLVFIGRLSPEKNPEWAVEISKLAGIELIIIGEGPMRNEIEKRKEESTTNFDLLGRLENPWEELRLGDLLLVPSSFEGDGLVVIEGLAKGVPMLLRSIPDLNRFELPHANYCSSINDFVLRIKHNQHDVRKLLVPELISKPIVRARNIESIGDEWEHFIQRVTQKD
jgi:glycosyltransferase involved in cell wall biosynthesis